MKYLFVIDIFDSSWGNFDRLFMLSTPFTNNQDQIQPLKPVNYSLMEDRLSWKWKPELFFLWQKKFKVIPADQDVARLFGAVGGRCTYESDDM